jgi:hypothetical protein
MPKTEDSFRTDKQEGNLMELFDSLKGYKQCYGALHRPVCGGYCFMGCALDRIDHAWTLSPRIDEQEHQDYEFYTWRMSATGPLFTQPLHEEYGITETERETIVKLNDDFRWTLEEIADLYNAAIDEDISLTEMYNRRRSDLDD